jgi:hypothetical protein
LEEDEEVTIVLPLAEFMLRETFEDFTAISYRVPIGASLTAGSFTHSSASGLGHAEDGQLDGEESHTSVCASQSGSGTAMRRVTRPVDSDAPGSLRESQEYKYLCIYYIFKITLEYAP